MHVDDTYATWHFSTILISLRVEVAQISDFLVHTKIMSLLKAFFPFKFTTLYTGQKDIALIFLYLSSHMACSEIAFLQTAGAHYISNIS